MTERPEIRLAVLWPCWAGYLDAGLDAMFARYALSTLLVQETVDRDAPLDVLALPGAARCEHAAYAEGYAALSRRLEEFRPTVILVCSWAHPLYRRLCRHWAGRAARVMHIDNQWFGSWKQWGAVATSPLFVRRLTDFAFVPGDRQQRFARRLGFPPERILRPSLSGDTPRFAPIGGKPLADRKAFLFVGRLVPEKGVDQLAEAYRAYRAQAPDPWPLVVCGTGPLAATLAREPGVDMRGFVQPRDLPSQFAEAGCLLLPSVFEPYAVVVHEAAAAGLAIICSEACGAGDDFVDARQRNGEVVPTGDVTALTRAMLAMSTRSDDALEEARRRSSELGSAITPALWADRLASVAAFSATPSSAAVSVRSPTTAAQRPSLTD